MNGSTKKKLQLKELVDTRKKILKEVMLLNQQIDVYNNSIHTWSKSKSSIASSKLSNLESKKKAIQADIEKLDQLRISIESKLDELDKHWRYSFTSQTKIN